jgi:glycosyltransferase involved in cell wall biosynthesis
VPDVWSALEIDFLIAPYEFGGWRLNALSQDVEISVVVPVYGSPELIPVLVERLQTVLGELTEHYEVVLVFDCSRDDGWDRIRAECARDVRVKGIQLSRNFGQHYAITAGLMRSAGHWVVVMDCDLQDRPEEIPNLYAKAEQGFDIVFAQRADRTDGLVKRFFSKAFYRVFSYMTESHQDPSIANFGIYRRCVIDAILSMKDKIRYFPTMAQWVGFDATVLLVSHGVREAGQSTYSWRGLFRLAFDNMMAFSDKPLRLTVRLGMLICGLTVSVSGWYFMRYMFGGITVSGYTSLILSIWFLSGVIIFTLGVFGMYLARLFDQAKDRPVFIIKQAENLDDD